MQTATITASLASATDRDGGRAPQSIDASLREPRPERNASHTPGPVVTPDTDGVDDIARQNASNVDPPDNDPPDDAGEGGYR
jgi:hypothetical protein